MKHDLYEGASRSIQDSRRENASSLLIDAFQKGEMLSKSMIASSTCLTFSSSRLFYATSVRITRSAIAGRSPGSQLVLTFELTYGAVLILLILELDVFSLTFCGSKP
jgi:hypothetical protein